MKNVCLTLGLLAMRSSGGTRRSAGSFPVILITCMVLGAMAHAIGAADAGFCGILVLDPTGSSALDMSGGATLNLPNGDVIVNSSDQAAFRISGGLSGITAQQILITGNFVATGGSDNNLIPYPQTGVPPTPDPLASLPAPSTSGMPVFPGGSIIGSVVTLSPGVYTNHVSISSGATVTFEPGIYILQGGLESSGGSSLQGNGVMFYNQGQLTISGSGFVNLVPPSSGTYAGITVFQARGNTSRAVLSAGSSGIFAGAYYFPDTIVLELAGGSNIQLGTIITWRLLVSGGLYQGPVAVDDVIPVSWRQQYFGGCGTTTNSQSCATCDPDGDGMSNLQEYQAGTDPTNSASVFRIVDIRPEDEDMFLTWTAVGGKRYALQTTTGDSGGFSNDFVDLNPAIVATGTGETTVSVLHLGAATNAPARFYRVRLVP